MQDKWILVFHKEGFQLPVPFQFWQMIEKIKYGFLLYVSWNKFQTLANLHAALVYSDCVLYLEYCGSHLSGWHGHMNVSVLQSLDLLLGSSFASGDNGASVTHTAAWRGCQTSNEGSHGLVVWTLQDKT